MTLAPYSHDAWAGTCEPSSASTQPTPITVDSTAVSSIAAAEPACLPTTVARSTSLRPSSSSPRVCRTTVSNATRAMAIRAVSATWFKTMPGRVSTAIGGPVIAMRAGEPLTDWP